jgi:ubiquinone/menaquinone biosynthesis C-methylase UbiE
VPTKSYDHLAKSYKLLEHLTFGKLLQNVRERAIDELLSRLKPHQHMLILGEGDGRFLRSFTQKCQLPCHVTCIDKSSQMLAKARAGITSTSSVAINFVHADATQIPFDASCYDIIVSLFFLDNFMASTLHTLIPKLTASLNTQGIWVIADFRAVQQGLASWRSRVWLWLMYRFFRLVTDIEVDELVDPTKLLEQSGMRLLEQTSFQNGFVTLEMWQQD